MAATIVVTCPKCKNHLKGPAEVQGRKVRCKSCNTVFTAEADPVKPATPPAPNRSKPTAPPARPAVKPAKTEAKAPAPQAPPKPPDDDANKPYTFMDEDVAQQIMAKAQAIAPIVGKDAKGMDIDGNPYGVTTLDLTPRCPHCAKEMDEGDIVCLNCGYNTQTRTHARTQRVYYNSGKDWTLWLLPGILCALAVLGIVGFLVWFEFFPSWQWDPENTNHRGVRIWVFVICAFPTFFALRFAIKRLVFHPRPPDVEKHK